MVERFIYFIKHKRSTLLWVFLLCVTQLAVGGLILFVAATIQTRTFISDISRRVQEDIHYTHGQWDTSAYDADPEIPGNYRLYVITKDGFIIDRWRPISSYLNTSDLRYLLNYQQPTTIKAVTGQPWRILTLPIHYNGETIGGVTVGSYAIDNQDATDTILKQSGQKLLDAIHIKKGVIDVSAINVRQVPVGISFQVVDGANTIQLKSDNASSIDRLPNYIDPSYITKELGPPTFRLITDATTGELFMSRSMPLYDDSRAIVGTVIIARTISPNLSVLAEYFGYGIICALCIVVIAGWVVGRKKQSITHVEAATSAQLSALTLDAIIDIRFVKNESSIEINGRRIPVTYATNQYYMCVALFASPKKAWHVDELLEKFGETNTRDSWRKVYDAMTSINKKGCQIIDEKLIITTNKTYKINPVLINKIKK